MLQVPCTIVIWLCISYTFLVSLKVVNGTRIIVVFFRIAVILPRTMVDLFVYFQVVTNLIPPGTISAEYWWEMFVLFGNTF